MDLNIAELSTGGILKHGHLMSVPGTGKIVNSGSCEETQSGDEIGGFEARSRRWMSRDLRYLNLRFLALM
jgi:hypothetical protein